MGVDLGSLVMPERIEFKDLENKIVAIDAFNTIYQFLSIIRQRDGTPLLDSKGNITSHLSGLFYRTLKLLEYGIKPVYVFDGKPPSWKEGTIKTRIETKEDAKKKWEDALKQGNLDEARKYAQATSTLTPEMVDESKQLLDAMGVPHVQAISEGEAEAAYLTIEGKTDCAASQDYDSLLFGAPVLIRNLTVSGRRKLPGRDRYAEVYVERINLKNSLENLGISREQLVWIGLLVGTDFNDGVKGIGPKKGLKLVKECKSLKEVHAKSKSEEDIELWRNIEQFFMIPDVNDAEIAFREINRGKVIEILCEKHEFSENRVEHAINNFVQQRKEKIGQEKLGKWF